MINILSIISSVLGITTALVAIFQYFRGTQSKNRTLVFISVLLFTTFTIFLWMKLDKDKEQLKEEQVLKADAQSVAEAILITGYEDTGDWVGYLSQITSFYYRHQDKFLNDYEYYKTQRDNWTEFLKVERSKGNFIPGYSSELTELKGLVSSGERQLEQLAK